MSNDYNTTVKYETVNGGTETITDVRHVNTNGNGGFVVVLHKTPLGEEKTRIPSSRVVTINEPNPAQ